MEKTIEYSIEDNFYVYDILDKISNNILIDFAYSSNKDQLSENQQIITKITKNITVIKNLYENNIICVKHKLYSIFNKLNNLNNLNYNKNEYLTHYKKIRKILGHIIYDIFRYSYYHVLISNVPKTALPIINNNINDINDIDNLEPVNSETIYHTVEYYIGSDTVDNIFQVSSLAYLVKMKNECNAKFLCNKLNKMQIGSNIINVELLNPDAKINLDVTEPIVNVTDPIVNVTEPIVNVTEPIISFIEPVVNVTEPIFSFIEPVVNVSKYDILKMPYLNDIDDEIEIVYSKDDNNNKVNENTNISDNNEMSFIGYIYNKISNVFGFFRKS